MKRPNRQLELFREETGEKINLPQETRERARALLAELMISATGANEEAVESEGSQNG